jgi:hypothetical protein
LLIRDTCTEPVEVFAFRFRQAQPGGFWQVGPVSDLELLAALSHLEMLKSPFSCALYLIGDPDRSILPLMQRFTTFSKMEIYMTSILKEGD